MAKGVKPISVQYKIPQNREVLGAEEGGEGEKIAGCLHKQTFSEKLNKNQKNHGETKVITAGWALG